MSKRSYGKVLLIDDDIRLARILSIYLRNVGFSITTATNATDAMKISEKNSFDVMILDVIMPNKSGIELCEEFRANGNLTPVIFLTCKDDKNFIIEGLGVGADDYLTKPFDQDELVARLLSIIRRNKKNYSVVMSKKYDIVLNVLTYTVTIGQKTGQLTKKETLLLQKLISEAPHPVQRDTILHDVWGIDGAYTSNRLDVYVKRLRTKLKVLSDNDYIHTLRNNGYYLKKTSTVN